MHIYGVADVRNCESLDPSISTQTTPLIMPKLFSVFTKGGHLQMMKMSRHSIRNRSSYEHKNVALNPAEPLYPDLSTDLSMTLSSTALKLVSDISPQPELHYVALGKVFRHLSVEL